MEKAVALPWAKDGQGMSLPEHLHDYDLMQRLECVVGWWTTPECTSCGSTAAVELVGSASTGVISYLLPYKT